MYTLKEETKKELLKYKFVRVSEEVGMNYHNLSDMVKKNKSCDKKTAYCISKWLDSEKEIVDYFDRKED